MKKRQEKAGKPPERWSEETLSLRKKILQQYQFDAIGNAILANLLDAHTRMLQAAEILARQGTIVRDRFQQLKPHPAFEQESVSRASMLKHAHALGVKVAELAEGQQ